MAGLGSGARTVRRAQAGPEARRGGGRGSDSVALILLNLDRKNPQPAARMATAFRPWRTLEPSRRALAEVALRKIKSAEKLSRDLADIVERALA